MQPVRGKIISSKPTAYYINGILENDRKILREIYSAFLPGLKKFVLNNKGSLDDAHDVFQDAILILFTKTADPDFKINSEFKNYLQGICRNLWLKQLKKKYRKEVTLDKEKILLIEADFEQVIIEQEKERLFFDCLAKLEQTCQAVLKAFFEGQTLKLIAQNMGYTEKYIKQKNYKCKQHLAHLIEADKRYEELMER